jgi:hypothetical protein
MTLVGGGCSFKLSTCFFKGNSRVGGPCVGGGKKEASPTSNSIAFAPKSLRGGWTTGGAILGFLLALTRSFNVGVPQHSRILIVARKRSK